MPLESSLSRWGLGAAGLGIGLLIGYLAGLENQSPINPQQRALDADLWMQTSAEYHACCLQTYRLAGERLRARLAALPEQGRPPAVVMDLDETVFDNSPFQTWLYRHREVYTPAQWSCWERDCPQQVRLVPGAREFIAGAEAAGATVVYISNRLTEYESSTIRVLEHLGISTRGIADRLLLTPDKSLTDKSGRRREAEKRFRVVMFVGDNLRDFSEEYRAPTLSRKDDVTQLRKAIAERKARVEAEAHRWGDEWFILPNPCYGEWARLEGRHPVEVLNPAVLTGP